MRSKEVGFDAVKLQAFNEKAWNNWPQYPNLRYNSVNKENIGTIDTIAKLNQIEWFCTPCYPEAVEFLDPYVKRYKIRHADKDDYYIHRAIVKSGKPFYTSGKDIYCVPKYPTDWKDIDLVELRKSKGYSCHCKNIASLDFALSLKLEYYEIHMVLYHSKDFVDDNVSYTYEEIKSIL